MLNNIGKYYKIKSDIHNLSPLSKIISILIFIFSLLITRNISIMVILITFEIIIILGTNIPIKNYLKSIYSLKILLMFLIFVNLLTKTSLILTIVSVLKIIGIVIYTSILTLTTTPSEITKGLNSLFKPLKIFKIKTGKLSLSISLALRFIPVIINQANKILKSLAARGLDYSNSNFKNRIFAIKSIILPMFILSFKRADKLADVMELKLYNFDVKRTNYNQTDWNYLDNLFLLIHVIILIISLKEVV
ncbi:MAG: energy-coupling factor transporter transmembrane protein EcfT [Bacilli bacterium]